MSGDERRAALEKAYAVLKDALAEILYEEDPDGVGSTVAAPLDEYSEEAARLIVALRGAVGEADVAEHLSGMFDEPSGRLIRRVHETWTRVGGPQW